MKRACKTFAPKMMINPEFSGHASPPDQHVGRVPYYTFENKQF